MIYDLMLAATRSEIARGLLSGQYVRWGGVVRVAKGLPGAGQIVGMLRDVPSLATPVGAVLKGLDVVVNAHGHHVTQTLVREGFARTQQMLGQVMGISSIGAAASVLNLGLTAAGFYIMNEKLNRLQSSVSRLTGVIGRGFAQTHQGIEEVQAQLVELRLISIEHGQDMVTVLEGIYDIKRSLFAEKIAALLVATKGLDEQQATGESSQQRKYLDDIRRVRYSLQGDLQGRHLRPNQDPRQFLDTMMLFRGWAMAGAAEVLVERRMLQLEAGSRLGFELADQARTWASRWAANLVPADELGGVARFGHSRLRPDLLDETRHRLFRLQAGEEPGADEIRALEAQGAHDVVLSRPMLDDERWAERQLALAETLDMIEETTERIESMAYEARYCEAQRIGFEEWEQLPAPADEDEWD